MNLTRQEQAEHDAIRIWQDLERLYSDYTAEEIEPLSKLLAEIMITSEALLRRSTNR